MTDLDRQEIHKLVDRILDNNEKSGTYQSVIAEMGVHPATRMLADVRYKRFIAEIKINLQENYLYGGE